MEYMYNKLFTLQYSPNTQFTLYEPFKRWFGFVLFVVEIAFRFRYALLDN